MKFVVSIIAVFAAAGCAADRPAVPATELASADQERTCRIIQATGTRLVKRKVCLTRAEWQGIEREAQEHSERMQNTNRSRQGE